MLHTLHTRSARQKLYEFGDNPERYLASLVKKRADSRNIVSIADSNGPRLFDTSVTLF